MSWNTRRALFVLAAVAVLGLLADQAIAQRQPRPRPNPNPQPPPKPSVDVGSLSGLELPVDDDLKRKFELIQDHLDSKTPDWKIVADELQKLLNRDGATFVEVTRIDESGKK